MDIQDFGLLPHVTTSLTVGDKYGTLTVEAIGKKPNTYRYVAVCRCDCGTFPHLVNIDGLRTGSIASCGCGQKKAVTTHGQSSDPLFRVWKNMMNRCYDPRLPKYATYGARGIYVCNRWHDPKLFITDMKATFFKGAQIDRIDNEGEYSPENCRWVTSSQNNRNKSNNVLVTWNGKTQPIATWADELGISPSLLYKRIQVYKWSVERAFTQRSMKAAERLHLARSARKKAL